MSDSDSNASDLDQMPNGFADYPGDLGGHAPEPEEHLWLGQLSSKDKILKFEGCDDSDANLILKRATLDADCEDESRHVIQVISLDHNDSRIIGTLCSVSLNGNGGSVALDNLVISPPTAFKLIKGEGPLTITANLMKDAENGDEDILNDLAQEYGEEGEEISESGESDMEDEPKIEEIEEEKKPAETSSEEEIEKPKKPSPAKKRKIVEDKKPAGPNSKKQDIKTKIESQKSKTEKEAITNAKSLIEAIKSYKGGKPTKKNKFDNWVKNQFKVQDKGWIEQAWKVVQEGK